MCRTFVLTWLNMTIDKEPGELPLNTSTLWATVCVLLAVLVAGVALALSGMETAAIVALLTGLTAIGGTLVAILDKVTTTTRVNVRQDHKLDVIDRRTNGELTGAIAIQINEALNARFGPPPATGPEQ